MLSVMFKVVSYLHPCFMRQCLFDNALKVQVHFRAHFRSSKCIFAPTFGHHVLGHLQHAENNVVVHLRKSVADEVVTAGMSVLLPYFAYC